MFRNSFSHSHLSSVTQHVTVCCKRAAVCSRAPSQGSKPESRRTQKTSRFHHSCVWLLTSPIAAPLPSHSSLPPSSLCSGRASHSEQQAAGGDDIICTAAHCSIGSEQRHVSLTLTISSLPPSIFQSRSPTSARDAALSPPPESRSQSGSGARRFFPSRVSACWTAKEDRRATSAAAAVGIRRRAVAVVAESCCFLDICSAMIAVT